MNRIFTITPGRSGIHWLSAILRHCTKLPRSGKKEYFKFFDLNTYQKQLLVAKLWNELPDPYVSTTLFPKNGYLRFLHYRGSRFIHLIRNIKDNAVSWMNMDGVPGRSQRGLAYHPNPNSLHNCMNVRDIDKLTDFQLCMWLCLEMNARSAYMKSLGAQVYSVDLYRLNIADTVVELLEWIGIDYDINGFFELQKIDDLKNIQNSIASIPDNAKRSTKFYISDSVYIEQLDDLKKHIVENTTHNILI